MAPTPAQRASARKIAQSLLRGGNRPEDNVRQDIGRLLDALEIENIITFRTPAGPADLYLPRRRIVIETKSAGLADNPDQPQARANDETPKQQLERYLLSELVEERARIPLEDSADLHWTGILTDGRVWHVWTYDPQYEAPAAQPICLNFRPANTGELLERMVPVLAVEPVGKPWIPADPVPVFRTVLEELREIHGKLTGNALRTTETKMALWLDMLRGSGMAPVNSAAQHRLFVAHSFLVALARGVEHTLLDPGNDPDPRALLGSGFVAWLLDTEAGRTWARGLLARIHGYEWRTRPGDVLRPLYEQLVTKDDRKDFGEVYTPDWLAEMMVGDVLDAAWCEQAVTDAMAAIRGRKELAGIGVLDPACGSGTFLYHAVQRILGSDLARSLHPGQRADVACRLVHGLDIHPVAAEFSRATVLRALPTPPPTGRLAVNVFQGDALMIRGTEEGLFRPQNGETVITSPKGQEVRLPKSFVRHPEFPDLLRRLVDDAQQGRDLAPDIAAVGTEPEDKTMLVRCHQVLAEIISKEGNSVWAWYISNILGPTRLARTKVNRIVANPPWVKMSTIQVPDRKRALEILAGKPKRQAGRSKKPKPEAGHLNLWTGGPQAPHFDIAQLFIRFCRETYLQDPTADPAAWVTKMSAIRAGNWKKFRAWHNAGIRAQVLDLADVQVFGGGDARRCCVLYEIRPSGAQSPDGGEPVKLTGKCPGGRPRASSALEEVLDLIEWAQPPRFPEEESGYSTDRWRQGASITPKVLTFVASQRDSERSGYKTISTARSQHSPWNEIEPRHGDVPAHWLVDMMASESLVPFGEAPRGLQTIIVPRAKNGQLLGLPSARREPLWAELDDLYQDDCGKGQNTPQTLLARIDYNRNISVQLPLRKSGQWLVIYPKSGDIMRGCRIMEGTAILQDTTYRLRTESAEEAAFLVAVLNAPALERAFCQSRTSGRDFQKSPWRSVPVPAFDPDNSVHEQLAQAAVEAERSIQSLFQTEGEDLPRSQVSLSKRIRSRLKDDGVFDRLNALVAQILPAHVAEAADK